MDATTAWDGARNLRDLGGLPLVGGGRTAPGQVFRSAAPDHLSARGWQDARAAGLLRVVDLRNDEEKGRRTAPTEVEVVAAPLEDPHDGVYLEEVGAWLDHPAGWEPTLRFFPGLVAEAFTAVAGSPGPVLLHCAGGRDRAGLLSVLILAVAGVEPVAVVADYAGGFRGAAAHPGHGLAWDGTTASWVRRDDPPPTPEELEDRVAERLPAARSFLAGTDVPAYLRGAGVGSGDLDWLRARLRGP